MSDGGRVGDWAEVAIAMDRCLRVFADFVRPILVEHDASTVSVSNLVFMLSLGAGDARVSDVVRNGRYLGSNASYALKSLQEGGYIERRQDPQDRRNAIVRWTDRGRSIADAVAGACKADSEIAIAAVAALRSFEEHCVERCPAGGR